MAEEDNFDDLLNEAAEELQQKLEIDAAKVVTQ